MSRHMENASPRSLRVFGWAFWIIGALTSITVVADLIAWWLFGSPLMDDNRVSRFMEGLGLIYVGSLHMALADERDKP